MNKANFSWTEQKAVEYGHKIVPIKLGSGCIPVPMNEDQIQSFTTGLKIAHERNGIATSQAPKYGNRLWEFVEKFMEVGFENAMTPEQISEQCCATGNFVKPGAIRRIIVNMIHKEESINSCVRAFGQECYQSLSKFGRIRRRSTEQGAAYYFDGPKNRVEKIQRNMDVVGC